MKYEFTFLWILAVLLSPVPSLGGTEDDPVEAQLAAIRAEHRMTVARALNLGPSEAPAFWRVYDGYSDRIHAIEQRLVQLVVDYSRSRDEMTDDKAAELLGELQALEREQLEARHGFATDLVGVVSDRTRARAYQIERKFQAVADFNRAKSVPLVE